MVVLAPVQLEVSASGAPWSRADIDDMLAAMVRALRLAVLVATCAWLGGCGGDDGGTSSSSAATALTMPLTSATESASTADPDSGTAGEPAPRVRLQTSLGDLVFEIYEAQAPITAGNFLTYVDDGLFESATFYRTVTLDNQAPGEVPIEVIQGGLGGVGGLPPIGHETTDQTGVLHLDGTLSMARAEVGTAASEFFVCIGDQPELDFGGARNPDGQGFAAFGRLVEGNEVAVQIHQQPASGQDLDPPVEILAVTRE